MLGSVRSIRSTVSRISLKINMLRYSYRNLPSTKKVEIGRKLEEAVLLPGTAHYKDISKQIEQQRRRWMSPVIYDIKDRK